MMTYWTMGDVAKAASVNPQTVAAWQRRGLLEPVARTPFGTRLYDPSAVRRFVRKRRVRRRGQR